jgi:hypothetical protein
MTNSAPVIAIFGLAIAGLGFVSGRITAPEQPALLSMSPGGHIEAGYEQKLIFCQNEVGLTVEDASYSYDYGISRPEDMKSDILHINVDCGMKGGKNSFYVRLGGISDGVMWGDLVSK